MKNKNNFIENISYIIINMKYIFNNKLQEYIENLSKNLKEQNVMIYFIEDEILFLLINIIIYL